MLILRLLVVLLILCIPASANFRLGSHGGPGSVAQTIASVPLSNNSFNAGSSSGTVVGIVGTPVMSPTSPAFLGSCCSLSGTDAASFQIVGGNLETNGTPCPSGPCTFHINLVATQAGIGNSPFSQAVTITGNELILLHVFGISAMAEDLEGLENSSKMETTSTCSTICDQLPGKPHHGDTDRIFEQAKKATTTTLLKIRFKPHLPIMNETTNRSPDY